MPLRRTQRPPEDRPRKERGCLPGVIVQRSRSSQRRSCSDHRHGARARSRRRHGTRRRCGPAAARRRDADDGCGRDALGTARLEAALAIRGVRGRDGRGVPTFVLPGDRTRRCRRRHRVHDRERAGLRCLDRDGADTPPRRAASLARAPVVGRHRDVHRRRVHDRDAEWVRRLRRERRGLRAGVRFRIRRIRNGCEAPDGARPRCVGEHGVTVHDRGARHRAAAVRGADALVRHRPWRSDDRPPRRRDRRPRLHAVRTRASPPADADRRHAHARRARHRSHPQRRRAARVARHRRLVRRHLRDRRPRGRRRARLPFRRRRPSGNQQPEGAS